MKEKSLLAYRILLAITVILILCFIVTIIIDWINYNEFMSAPFYASILFRNMEFVVPALACFVISLILKNKNKKQ